MKRHIMRVVSSLVLVILMHASIFCTNIVFVHLGSCVPEYVYVALEQARLFNPDTDIYLIANKEAINNSSYDFSQNAYKVVLCEDLACSKYHQVFNQITPLDPLYREGFWRKATERFFYIHELVASLKLRHVVHIESDNMLYVDITTIRDALSHYKGIGAVFDCDDRCIPSFVYMADQDALEHLVEFIAAHAAKGQNDMSMLAAYHKKFAKDYVDNLPLIMPEYAQRHSLMNDLKQSTANASQYFNNFAQFNSIFDGAALGQYLGGIDPRNGPSGAGFINETCLVNPSYLKFEWRVDCQGRKVPFALLGSSVCRINNLHIHSKQLEEFRS